MRDSLYDSVVTRPALAIATRTANTAVNGITVDKMYQNNMFRTVMFSVFTGTLTDGSTAVTMQDSPDNSSWSTAATSDVQGTLPSITSSDDDKVYDVGYTGPQRYVRLVFTQSGATSGGTMGAIAIMSQARRTPVTH